MQYQDEVCAFVPNGGQVVVDNPYNDFENAVRDMGRMHVTYIDQYWQSDILTKWNGVVLSDEWGAYAGKTGLDYVRDHLGYRLLMSGASIFVEDEASQTTKVSVAFKNVGFAPLYANPQVILLVKSTDGSISSSYSMTHDLMTLTGSAHPEQTGSAEAVIPLQELPNGDYDLYLDVQEAGSPIYLGNTQQREDGLGYHVGSLSIKEGTYVPRPKKPGVLIRYRVENLTDAPVTSIYRVDVKDALGSVIYSNLYAADVTDADGQSGAVQTMDIDAGTYKGQPYEFLPIVPSWALTSYHGTAEDQDMPYSISNLNVTETSAADKSYAGLFSYVSNFEFKDMVLTNSHIEAGAKHSGGIVGYLDWSPTAFLNVSADNVAVIAAGSPAGTLAGYGWSYNVSFTDCLVTDSNVTSDGNYAGGLMGGCGGTSMDFIRCRIKADTGFHINGLHAGGFIGDAGSAATFLNCTAEGSGKTIITGTSYAGGFVGNAVNGSLTNCDASEIQIKGTGSGSNAGGLIGRMTDSSLTDCNVSSAAVEGLMNAGGLVGGIDELTDGACLIESSAASGVTVSATNYSGGLVGNGSGGMYQNSRAIDAFVRATSSNGEAGGLIGRLKRAKVSGCGSYGESCSDGNVSGGLIGAVRSDVLIEDSFAAVKVNGYAYVGGLIGNLSNPDDGETTNVVIHRSYAHSDIYVPVHTVDASYPVRAGGLIGVKNSLAQAAITDAYAAGSINMNNLSGMAGGLIGGTDYPATDVNAANVYSAMTYQNTNSVYSLFWAGSLVNGHYLDAAGITATTGSTTHTTTQLMSVDMGSSFTAAEDGYPFPVLIGLPRYGNYDYLDISVLQDDPVVYGLWDEPVEEDEVLENQMEDVDTEDETCYDNNT